MSLLWPPGDQRTDAYIKFFQVLHSRRHHPSTLLHLRSCQGTDTLAHSFSLTHPAQSPSQSVTHATVHFLTPLITRPHTQSFTYSLSLTSSVTHSLTFPPSLVHFLSLFRLLTRTFTHFVHVITSSTYFLRCTEM